jgi:hypothetical protein
MTWVTTPNGVWGHCWMNMHAKHFRGDLNESVCQASLQLGILCSTIHDVLCKRKIVCLQASVGMKDNTWRSWFEKAVCFQNAFPWQRGQFFFSLSWWGYISCVWNSQEAHLSCMGKWKFSWCYWSWAWFTKVNVWCTLMKNKVVGPFLSKESNNDWWHLSGYMNIAFHHIPLGTVFQLNEAPPHFCCVFAFWDTEFPHSWIGRGVAHSLVPLISRFDSLDFLFGIL